MADYKERQKLVSQNIFYAIQRIDLLIISISGAGIYLCLETLKLMYTNKQPIGNQLKVSAGLFIGAIMVNFISQFLGHRSNRYDFLMCEEKLEDHQSDECIERAEFYDKKSALFDKLTDWANYLSTALMLAGLIFCFLYFIVTY